MTLSQSDLQTCLAVKQHLARHTDRLRTLTFSQVLSLRDWNAAPGHASVERRTAIRGDGFSVRGKDAARVVCVAALRSHKPMTIPHFVFPLSEKEPNQRQCRRPCRRPRVSLRRCGHARRRVSWCGAMRQAASPVECQNLRSCRAPSANFALPESGATRPEDGELVCCSSPIREQFFPAFRRGLYLFCYVLRPVSRMPTAFASRRMEMRGGGKVRMTGEKREPTGSADFYRPRCASKP